MSTPERRAHSVSRLVLSALSLSLAAGVSPACTAREPDFIPSFRAPGSRFTAAPRAFRDAARRDAFGADTDGAPSREDASVAAHDGGPDASSIAISTSVLTQHNDLSRTGAVLTETALDVDAVRSSRFGKLFARQVDDQIFAQPLVVSGLDVAGRKRNLVLVTTVNDTVYAFDADDSAATDPLWTRSFALAGAVPPRNTDMTGACSGHYTDYRGNIGIVGTPVVDPASATIYFVARTKEDGAFYQRLHALSLTDGGERPESPVLVAANLVAGDGASRVAFDPLHENQRPGLALVDGTVWIGWGGHCDWQPFYGWLIGYDAATLRQTHVYNAAPTGESAGIWQGGQAPSAEEGDLLVVTGNGTAGVPGNPRSTLNRGQSIVRLRPSGATLDVVTWFTPFDYRVASPSDTDLGTTGLLLVPGTRLAVSGSKAGFLYVVNRDDMGGLTTSASGDDNIVQYVDVNSPERIYGSPVFWKGPDRSFVYVWAENDQLKAYPLAGTSTTPGSAPLDVAGLLRSAVSPPGMPGGLLSISADGSRHGTGIVWAARDIAGNANQQVLPGMLQAFDAETLEELYSNQTNRSRDDCGNLAKFSYPTIANGKVYLASFSKQMCVYGLMPP